MNRGKILISLIILMSGIAIATGILWFNKVYSGGAPTEASVTCSASPSSVVAGSQNVVTLIATPRDFNCSTNSYSYTWSSSHNPDIGISNCNIGQCTTRSFSTNDIGNIVVSVTASCGNQEADGNCSFTVTGGGTTGGGTTGGGTTGHSVLKVEVY